MRLTQQGSHHTGHLVGVGQYGHASLHQHLVFSHIGALLGEVGVHDAAVRHVGVLFHVGEVVDRVLQTVDVGTEGGTDRTNLIK